MNSFFEREREWDWIVRKTKIKISTEILLSPSLTPFPYTFSPIKPTDQPVAIPVFSAQVKVKNVIEHQIIHSKLIYDCQRTPNQIQMQPNFPPTPTKHKYYSFKNKTKRKDKIKSIIQYYITIHVVYGFKTQIFLLKNCNRRDIPIWYYLY